MKYSRLSLSLMLLLTLFLYGCSARPVEQIEQTEKTMEQAKAEYAEQFAPEDWRAAEEAWKEADAALQKESYGQATTLLLKAKSRYAKARDLAKNKRADAIREITGFQKTAEVRFGELKSEIEANAKKLTPARRKTLDDACKDIEEKIAKVTTQLENGQYSEAKYLAQTTMRQVWETRQELEGFVGGKKTS